MTNLVQLNDNVPYGEQRAKINAIVTDSNTRPTIVEFDHEPTSAELAAVPTDSIIVRTDIPDPAPLDVYTKVEVDASQAVQNTAISNGVSAIEGLSAAIQDINAEQATQNSRLTALENAPGSGATVQPPFVKSVADNDGSNVFTLPKTPAVVFDVWVLDGDAAMHYLRLADYSVTGTDVIISNPTLTSTMDIKINYTAL